MDLASEVALSEEARRLYMNYALSVITTRALPDVRDGLKPVQRRILFTMHHELHLNPDGRPAKCARIVGDVIGKYHPHGDTAVYDALVRMAQDWVMRAPLVDGQGNFGSPDGDSAAAYRYTEARLGAIAPELLAELGQKTVSYRPSFDGTRFEPVVLPARFPNLLVNGAQGIAVGMATSIPPHNLGELVDALVALIEAPELPLAKLLSHVKGPDFPSGGELLATKAELMSIYEGGHGTLKLRGRWKLETIKKTPHIILTAIPYGLERRTIVEKIAEVIIQRKLPALVDVRDESTEQVRVVLELKKASDPELVMAYLFKNTPLQSTVSFNMNCLVPTENPDIGAPERLGLKALLQHFLVFRFEVVTKRMQHELDQLEKRLHILDGLLKVFDALDEIIRIIRKSEGKADAATKIMKRFDLDPEQTDAILELKLYRLARLEIQIIQEEADKKRAAAEDLHMLLSDSEARWGVVKEELSEIKETYATPRITRIKRGESDLGYSEEDFIIDEDQIVIVSANGWVKRQGTVRDLESTRVRSDDRVLSCLGGSTRATVAFFTSTGSAYVCRIADVPPSTGYGDPLQKLFRFSDGEEVVGACSFDPRMLRLPEQEEIFDDGTPCPPYGVAITKLGQALRFPLWGHREVSTKGGRRFARLKPGDKVIHCFVQQEELDEGYVIAASTDGHALAVALDELAVLAGPGRGTMLIKLAEGVELLAARYTPSLRTQPLRVFTEKGRKYDLFADALRGSRGGRGRALVKRSGFASVEHRLPAVPELTAE